MRTIGRGIQSCSASIPPRRIPSQPVSSIAPKVEDVVRWCRDSKNPSQHSLLQEVFRTLGSLTIASYTCRMSIPDLKQTLYSSSSQHTPQYQKPRELVETYRSPLCLLRPILHWGRV